MKNPTPVTRRAVGMRAATDTDIDVITAIWHAGWRDAHLGHVPDDLIRHRRIADHRARVPAMLGATTVATLDGRVAGFVVVLDDEIEQLYVDAEARGTGVAGALLAHGEADVAERFDRAWLAVAAGNARARRFYERQGWTDCGPFAYEAWAPGTGTITVPVHRYETDVRSAA